MSNIRPENRPKFAFGFAIGFGIPGLFMLIGALSGYLQSRKTADWPQVSGAITVSRVYVNGKSIDPANVKDTGLSENDTRYRPHIEYTYSINGIDRTGSRITRSDSERLYPDQPIKLTKKYPAGANVSVFYDPEDPTKSILEPGAQQGVASLLVMGLLVMGLAAGMVFAGIRELKKLKRNKTKQ